MKDFIGNCLKCNENINDYSSYQTNEPNDSWNKKKRVVEIHHQERKGRLTMMVRKAMTLLWAAW